MKKDKLQPLDVVRTKFGTVCIVDDVSSSGCVSLVLPKNSSQKVAWYRPEELTLVGTLSELVDQLVA